MQNKQELPVIDPLSLQEQVPTPVATGGVRLEEETREKKEGLASNNHNNDEEATDSSSSSREERDIKTELALSKSQQDSPMIELEESVGAVATSSSSSTRAVRGGNSNYNDLLQYCQSSPTPSALGEPLDTSEIVVDVEYPVYSQSGQEVTPVIFLEEQPIQEEALYGVKEDAKSTTAQRKQRMIRIVMVVLLILIVAVIGTVGGVVAARRRDSQGSESSSQAVGPNEPNYTLTDESIYNAITLWAGRPMAIQDEHAAEPANRPLALERYGDIRTWDVSSVTSLENAFAYTQDFDYDLSSWDTSSVTSVDYLFRQTVNFAGNLSGWDTSSTTSMKGLFRESANFSSDLSSWDSSKVTNLLGLFKRSSNFFGDLSAWDVSSVEILEEMFDSTDNFQSTTMADWNTSGAIDIWGLFQNSANFAADVGRWDISNAKDFGQMFYNSSNFSSDLSRWNVSKGVDFCYMFANSTGFGLDLSRWDTSKVECMSSLFYRSSNFHGNVSTWNTESVTDALFLFLDAENFSGDVSQWDLSKVSDMRSFFRGVSNYFASDLSSWDTSSVTTMERAFFNSPGVNQTLCWNLCQVSAPTLSSVFCGSNGAFDCDCIPEDKLSFVNANCPAQPKCRNHTFSTAATSAPAMVDLKTCMPL